MVQVEFDNAEGIALLTCMNYLFSSIQDIESIKDEQQKKDAELEYYRSIAMMQGISDASMKALIDKLEVLRIALMKEGSDVASDISVVEMHDEPIAA